jgi:hypothetical protein
MNSIPDFRIQFDLLPDAPCERRAIRAPSPVLPGANAKEFVLLLFIGSCVFQVHSQRSA